VCRRANLAGCGADFRIRSGPVARRRTGWSCIGSIPQSAAIVDTGCRRVLRPSSVGVVARTPALAARGVHEPVGLSVTALDVGEQLALRAGPGIGIERSSRIQPRARASRRRGSPGASPAADDGDAHAPRPDGDAHAVVAAAEASEAACVRFADLLEGTGDLFGRSVRLAPKGRMPRAGYRAVPRIDGPPRTDARQLVARRRIRARSFALSGPRPTSPARYRLKRRRSCDGGEQERRGSAALRHSRPRRWI
jgi:hypothetical protein